jgi:hypothetical protein
VCDGLDLDKDLGEASARTSTSVELAAHTLTLFSVLVHHVGHRAAGGFEQPLDIDENDGCP